MGVAIWSQRPYGIWTTQKSFKFSGLFAWLLWRSVYLMKMPGISRKLRVALDWTADLFFRRDYVQLGVHRGPDSQSANVARHSVAEQEDTID